MLPFTICGSEQYERVRRMERANGGKQATPGVSSHSHRCWLLTTIPPRLPG